MRCICNALKEKNLPRKNSYSWEMTFQEKNSLEMLAEKNLNYLFWKVIILWNTIKRFLEKTNKFNSSRKIIYFTLQKYEIIWLQRNFIILFKGEDSKKSSSSVFCTSLRTSSKPYSPNRHKISQFFFIIKIVQFFRQFLISGFLLVQCKRWFFYGTLVVLPAHMIAANW